MRSDTCPEHGRKQKVRRVTELSLIRTSTGREIALGVFLDEWAIVDSPSRRRIRDRLTALGRAGGGEIDRIELI